MDRATPVSVHILLIEPDPECGTIFRKAIALHFPTVTLEATRDIETALNLLRHSSYDVVVCDAFLAKRDRISFANEICVEKPDTALLIITGDTDISLDKFSDTLCVHHILHKPIDLQELIHSIEAALETIRGRKTPKGND
jgi:DNA-binding NtrC family response regulator